MIREKCDECGGQLIKKRVDFKMYGEVVGRFPAEVCKKCGEVCFDEAISDKIDAVVKAKGLWGLETKTRIGKVGDSLDVRIHKRLAEFLRLSKGKDAIIIPQDRHTLIVKV